MEFLNYDKSLHFFEPGRPVYKYHSDNTLPDSSHQTLIMNRGPIDSTIFRGDYSVDVPFYSKHFTCPGEDIARGQVECHTNYLTLAIPLDSNDARALVVESVEGHSPVQECDHVGSDSSTISFTDYPVVNSVLAEWRLGQSSLGTIMATSPRGTRIASATWSDLMVWPLDPEQIVNLRSSTYYPVRDYDRHHHIGRIHPVKLPNSSVIHALQWLTEMVLFAMTDQGLKKWDIGSMSQGREKDFAWGNLGEMFSIRNGKVELE